MPSHTVLPRNFQVFYTYVGEIHNVLKRRSLLLYNGRHPGLWLPHFQLDRRSIPKHRAQLTFDSSYWETMTDRSLGTSGQKFDGAGSGGTAVSRLFEGGWLLEQQRRIHLFWHQETTKSKKKSPNTTLLRLLNYEFFLVVGWKLQTESGEILKNITRPRLTLRAQKDRKTKMM